MTEQAKILIVNADDFGLSEGVNRGIIAAHQNGILSSTSIMPNGPAFDDAVNIALANPSLDVGVHLTLIGEKCVSPASELRDMVDKAGALPQSYLVFTRQLLSKRFSVGDVQTEIRAQVERVLKAGIDPSHIDSHQHVHMLPSVFAIVLDIAREYGIPAMRVPLDQVEPDGAGLISRLMHAVFLPRISRVRLLQVEAAGLRSPDRFWGLGVSGKMDEASLLGILRSLGPGINEIMCHPGVSDTETVERYPWDYSWDEERTVLQLDSVRKFVTENDIRLASFRDAW